MKKALVEKALGAEFIHHLGYEKGEKADHKVGNSRNGHGKKKVKGQDGEMEIAVPRDREGTLEPQLIKKGQRRFEGFDEKIISMYTRGMTVREIQGHLKELYGVEVSPDLISRVTDTVLEEVREWQNRPLDPVYPLVIFDALRIKIRDEGVVKNKAVYLALGMNVDGIKVVLGLWIEQTEGAKFWLRVMTELKNRDMADLLIAAVDGLKGFPEAITSVFPQARSKPASCIWCVTACALCPGRTVRKWPPISRPSTGRKPWRPPRKSSANSKPNGVADTPPSASPGAAIGSRSSLFWPTPGKSAK